MILRRRSMSQRTAELGCLMIEALCAGMRAGPNPDTVERAGAAAARMSWWWDRCLFCPKQFGHDGPHGPDVPDPLILVSRS